MNEVSRKEKKFLISVERYVELSHYLNNFLRQDPHNGNDGYKVRSLYFDSLDDCDYDEKEAGIELRRKIRLRLYDPRGDFAVLEMKQKQGDSQLKRSLKMPKEDAVKLIRGNYEVLLKYEEPFAKECYTRMHMYLYRPKTVVQYDRKAFIAKENKIRVTFDHNIVATESNFDIFDHRLCMYPVLDFYNIILEVKYNGFLLSYIKEALKISNRSELSVSKYILARNIGKNVTMRM